MCVSVCGCLRGRACWQSIIGQRSEVAVDTVDVKLVRFCHAFNECLDCLDVRMYVGLNLEPRFCRLQRDANMSTG